ncbi:hypothetical protein [Aquisphaera insulae]|uniref:hypothetical protein n=1 Tax=Aquisphaera insulae TaxID=2712864 RepID=UPI0013EC4C2A|nr:hypothetical protein [Aquisphaera insulae]
MEVEDLAYLGSRPGERPRHRLDSEKLIETARHLSDDINERLPSSSLSELARELVKVAVATVERGRSARRPILAVRAFSAAAVFSALILFGLLASHIRARWSVQTVGDLFVAFSAGTNLVILSAGALWSCVTLELRLKRRQALGFIEELREFIHVIDLTQLYYTPDLYRTRLGAGHARLAIDETYLLYCTQMLAVIGNLVPLYARGVTGDSILRAASEVEMLAIAVSTKHMTKAGAVSLMSKDFGRPNRAGD